MLRSEQNTHKMWILYTKKVTKKIKKHYKLHGIIYNILKFFLYNFKVQKKFN